MTQRGEGFKRPRVLPANIHRFNNQNEKWVAIVGTIGGMPYEIFTGSLCGDDGEDGIYIPTTATDFHIEKRKDSEGKSHYDLHFRNKKGVKTTIEGLEIVFNKEFCNYSRLIAAMLRYEVKVENVYRVVKGMYEDTETVNSWKAGMLRTLANYIGEAGRKRREDHYLELQKEGKAGLIKGWESVPEGVKVLEKHKNENIDYLVHHGETAKSIPIPNAVPEDAHVTTLEKKSYYDISNKCPEPGCSGELIFDGGCNHCPDCGWSQCG